MREGSRCELKSINTGEWFMNGRVLCSACMPTRTPNHQPQAQDPHSEVKGIVCCCELRPRLQRPSTVPQPGEGTGLRPVATGAMRLWVRCRCANGGQSECTRGRGMGHTRAKTGGVMPERTTALLSTRLPLVALHPTSLQR